MENEGNIILQQILTSEDSFTIKEVFPKYEYSENLSFLARNGNNEIFWSQLDLSLNLIVNNRFKNTDIYYDKGRVGLGRSPLFTYKVDIAVPKNSTVTALHIGDGSYGFSMGNGTISGFIPEIIGVGADETDTGMYIVGIAGNDKASNIPLIIIDGRSSFSTKLNNRPILGVTSGNYNEYSMVIDSSENLNVKGNISSSDVFISNISLLEIIANLQKQINELKPK